MSSKWLILIGCISVALFGSAFGLYRRQSVLAEQDRALRAQVSALTEQIGAAGDTRQIAMAAAALAVQSVTTNHPPHEIERIHAPPQSVDETARSEMTPEAALEAIKHRADERINDLAGQLDTYLASNRGDLQWSSTTSQAVAGVLEQIAGNRLLDVNCGASLCRVVVGNSTPDVQRELAAQIVGKPPFDQEVMYRYDRSTDSIKTILYVMRKGTSISSIVRPPPG